MKQKIAVTLDEELVAFVDRRAKGNRSEYLNSLLARERKQILETELIAALEMDAKNADYQADVRAWNSVAGDGIDAER